MDPSRPASRLSVLGAPDLRNPDGDPIRSVLAQPRRVALLAFLRLAEAGEPVARDGILGTFWPELPEDRALNALRQALHFLRRSLGPDAVTRTGDHLVSIAADTLACDAADFESLIAEERLAEAMALYRGPFLDGLPVDGPHQLDDWIERRRGRYARLAVDACSALSEGARSVGQNVAAADWARRLVELDPLEERGVALLIEAHAAEGDAVAAVRAYHEYAAELERELDLAPSAELTTRIEEISSVGERSSSVRPSSPAAGADAEGSTPRGPTPEREPARAAAEAPVGASPPPRLGGRVPGRHVRIAGAVAAVAGAVAAIGLLGRGGAPPPPEIPLDSSRASVAVLPFTNLSADSSNAFFVAGVHESLLVTLSKIGSIDVSSLQAVRPYAGSGRPASEIARELAVRSLMSGSVQRDGDRIRIIVELADAEGSGSIWSEVYERRLDDVFGVQAEIARSVANALSAALTATEQDRIDRRPTTDLEALDAYMRGRQAYLRLSLDGMNEAIEQYRAAIDHDAAFAAAWAGVADALLQRVQFFGYPMEWTDSARLLVEHAIELDPDLPEAHKTLGFVHSVRGRSRAALDAAERALSLRPGYADALNNAGWSRYALGDVVGAERLIARSFRLQPTVPQLRANVGAIWAALGRTEEAAAWLDGVLASDPGITASRTWRVFSDLQRGDPEAALIRARSYLPDEAAQGSALARAAFAATLARDNGAALEYARGAVAASPGADPFDMRRIETVLGFALIASGDRAGGVEVIMRGLEAVRRAVSDGADGWDPPWELASAYAALGAGPEALRHLEATVDAGFPHPILLRLDPTFDVVRADARFEELVRRAERGIDAQRAESRAAEIG